MTVKLTKSKKAITVIFVVFFSLFGIQSSYADYYPSGIQQNVSEQTLTDNGWTKFYEQTYGTPIGVTASVLMPTGTYVIFTGKAVGSSTLPVLAAAPTSEVFTQTVRNTPQLINGTYWYNTTNTSIGFAPTNTISQFSADVQSPSDALRLSWHLVSHTGGWRLGGINGMTGTELNGSTAYLKQVWTWGIPAPAPAPAPAPVNVRQTSNLSFAQSLHASDTLSDEDGQLRATVDQIMSKYGSLIK
jgi:hypothetical protein